MYGGIGEPASKTCLCRRGDDVLYCSMCVVCVLYVCIDVCCMFVDVCRCVDVWQGWDTTQINK